MNRLAKNLGTNYLDIARIKPEAAPVLSRAPSPPFFKFYIIRNIYNMVAAKFRMQRLMLIADEVTRDGPEYSKYVGFVKLFLNIKV